MQTKTPLLTTAEASYVVGISAPTLRRWAKAGIVPSVRLPGPKGAFRFVGEDLILALQSGRLRHAK